MVFDRIDAVEGERREQRRPHHGLAHGGDGGGVLAAKQMPAQAGLCALSVFEFNDARALDGLFAHAEKPGGDLRDHVVFVGDEPFRVSALAGAAERVPGLCGPDLGELGPDVRRAERHASAVPGDVDGYFGPRIVFPFVKKQLGVDVFATEVGGDLFGEHETQPVEPAAGIADLAFEIRRRLVAGFGHEPVACEKVGRPAIIAEGFENGTFVERKRLLRTIFHAEAAAFFALRADAPVVERTDHLPVARRTDMHAVLTGFNAFPA